MKIARDKWKHFFVGIPMGIILQLMAEWIVPGGTGVAIFISVIVSLCISYGFELFSLVTRKGHYEVLDALASMIGAILGIGMALLF